MDDGVQGLLTISDLGLAVIEVGVQERTVSYHHRCAHCGFRDSVGRDGPAHRVNGRVSKQNEEKAASDRQIMRRSLGGADAALVIDLRGGDVAVTEQLLYLANVDPGTQQERRGCRSQRMRRVRTA